ncbi:LacI family DNA-binding transcriptional regulator [Halioxenophilus sp. WMMB6]|uniref:LacI family DNA-binding transcriptional regulator n=1 Tax=Halioxenophilus sp. WMMB6 TaxID=3073815 RepID=UPI00295EC9F3|nr:LacI family DNA-binding transcriptional regulator [Halioxenophilus sp. WMMB6]
MKKKRVTTQDIAKRAGVSKATVSYVLNGTGSVSPEMKAKILALASEMGYQENRLAKATRTGKTHTIGLVVPDLCNPFFPEMAQAVVDAASCQGYSVFLVDARNSPEEEALGVGRLLEYAIEGLIWCPIDDDSVTKHNLTCPVVMTERPIPGFDNVYADSHSGGKLQGQLVLSHGHTDIGILSGPERSPVANLRKQGLYEALQGKVDVAWDFPVEYGITIPEEIAEQILASDVSCVVAANDTLAIGLLRLYHEHGIAVPDQVSIIGFDHIDWSDLVFPPLTTIALPISQLGTTAFETLLKRLENPELADQDIKLGVSVLQRESLAERAK